MDKGIFSEVYYLGHQRNFEVALNAGRLEEAVRILKGLPEPRDEDEGAQRLKTLAEGYATIAERVLKLETVKAGFSGEIREFVEKYGGFESAGKGLDAVDEFVRKYGTLEKVGEELERLREIGQNHNEFVEVYGGLEDVKRESDLLQMLEECLGLF